MTASAVVANKNKTSIYDWAVKKHRKVQTKIVVFKYSRFPPKAVAEQAQ